MSSQKQKTDEAKAKKTRKIEFQQGSFLKRKIVIRFTILLLAIPLFVALLVVYMLFESQLRSGVNQLSLVNQELITNVGHFANGLHRDMNEMVQQSEIRLAMQQEGRSSALLNALIKKYDSFSMFILISPDQRMKTSSTLDLDQKVDDRFHVLEGLGFSKVGWSKNAKSAVQGYMKCQEQGKPTIVRTMVSAQAIPGKDFLLYIYPIMQNGQQLGCLAGFFPIHRMYTDVLGKVQKEFSKVWNSFEIYVYDDENEPIWNSVDSNVVSLQRGKFFYSYEAWLSQNKKKFIAKQEINPSNNKTSFTVINLEKGVYEFEGLHWGILTTVTYSDFFNRFFNNLLVAALLFVVFAAIGIFFIHRTGDGVIEVLLKSIDTVKKMGEGELAQKMTVDRDDELGMLQFYLGKTAIKLRLLVRLMYQSRDESVQLSEIVRSRAGETLRSSQEQAALLEEASAAVEELSASIQSIFTASQKQLAGAETNKKAMQDLQKTFMQSVSIHEKIIHQAEETTSLSIEGRKMLEISLSNMDDVSESSQRILGIIDVINDIADQTDLLALNASIEAARAGDNGKGFAVVAQEISELAERSSSSSREIARMLRNTNQRVEVGREKLKDTDQNFHRINDAMEKLTNDIRMVSDLEKEQSDVVDQTAMRAGNVTELAREIAEATRMQNQSSEEITEDMNRANEITITNVERVESLDQVLIQLANVVEDGMRLAAKFRTKPIVTKKNNIDELAEDESAKEEDKETVKI